MKGVLKGVTTTPNPATTFLINLDKVGMLDSFSFCKIKPGTKKPQGLNWQKTPLTWEEVAGESACGILSGHGGFLAIDCDGQAAIDRLAELFGGKIPRTWAWTSGKPGRIQFGFFVLEELRDRFRKARYWEDLPDGSQLDFRWKGCQSVLPPSTHPETGAYHWVNSPEECAIAEAPKWLIEYAISLNGARKAAEQSIRLPARLYSFYKAPLKIWCLAQITAAGSGKAAFSLKWASEVMQRSISSVRRMLAQARSAGLLRAFCTSGDRAIAFPVALKKISKSAGLESLHEITKIKIGDDIKNLNIRCTEAIAAGLQRASIHAAKEAQKEIPKERRVKIVNPLSSPAAQEKRVLWVGERFCGVSEGFVLFGASQKAIARSRGISERSVQRHLSRTYRQRPSEVRGYRADLKLVGKVQICQRLPQRLNFLGSLQFSDWWIPELDGKFLVCGDRVYKCCCNVYQFEVDLKLVSYRFRRSAYKRFAGEDTIAA